MLFKPLQVLIPIFLFLVGFQIHAQTIRGKVINSKTKEPLQFTNVFINNTTIGSTTNEKGEFLIQTDLPASLELVASFVGFRTRTQKLESRGKSLLEVNFELEPLENVLTEVETRSKRDKKWERHLERFKRVFLAVPDDPIFKEMEIQNPWVLDFELIKAKKGPNYIHARADQALVVENKALGFEIEYYLQDYRFYKSKSLYYGLAFFKEIIQEDSLVQKSKEELKESSYLGSSRHFFRSLLVRQVGEEGFVIYKKNPHFFNEMRTNVLNEELGKSVDYVSQDSIRRIPLRNGTFRVILSGDYEIHYQKKPWRNEYYSDYYHPVSWITAPKGYFDIDRNGIIIDPTQVELSGYMGRQRLGRFLPYDFKPAENFESNLAEVDSVESELARFNNLREKPWITTNKSYYYPGEPIWFHAKMLYHNTLMQDSLSRVLYLEVLNPSYEIVQRESYYISEGAVSGGFILSDTLEPDDYFIRSYTNWMRNFPDRDMTLLPLPILDKNQMPAYQVIKEQEFFDDLTIKMEQGLALDSGKQVVEIKMSFLDQTDEPTEANLTVSVTDPSLVVRFNERKTLEQGLEWLDDRSPSDFVQLDQYPIEFGITLEGKFERTKKRFPYINPITIVQGDLEDYGIVETDSSGYFRATGLNFTDSASIAIAAMDEKNRPYGEVSLIENTIPVFKGSYPKYHYEKVRVPAQTIRFDQSGEYIELEEFVKEDDKMQRWEDFNYGYGEPDRKVTPEDLNNWPGLPLWEMIGMQFGNGRLGNYNYGLDVGQPLLIIDGQRYFYQESETAQEVCNRYLTSEVKSISIYTLNTHIFGLAGFAGVIMFDTIKGERFGVSDRSQFNSEGFQKFTVKGFSKHLDFNQMNSQINASQIRPTVFWKPDGKTDKGEFTFKFAPVEGVRTYDLFIEGMTEQGFPFTKIFRVDLN
ncbi:carboxypeptidase-like regulatory domain-containing protein [Algoriphagus aestuarii]|nr:carboxypeptidase-like regulatory domain-containing protein [Algoriphagus aestuarii]